MEHTESVVLLHDGPRVWLTEGADGLLRAFREPLPPEFTLESSTYDWEDVFTFLPEHLLVSVRACWVIAYLRQGSRGRPARVFSFDTGLPEKIPSTEGPLGRLTEARLGRVNEYALAGRIGDPETLVALLAVARDRLRGGHDVRGG